MGAHRVAETLARTGGLAVPNARRRLYETTQFVLQCCQSLESIRPGGVGFKASVRVRFLHAQVRRRIMRLVEARPGYYDVAAHGIPINDVDSIATIIGFSASVVFLALPRQGLFPTKQE